MRFMIIVKASPQSETGALPTEEQLAEMGRFNEELVKAGVMLAGEGLYPSSLGKRVRFSQAGRTVVEGPFAETGELVAGFWLIQAKTEEEALEWVKRIPFQEGEVELRRVYDTEDFAPSDPSGELRAAEERLRQQVQAAHA